MEEGFGGGGGKGSGFQGRLNMEDEDRRWEVADIEVNEDIVVLSGRDTIVKLVSRGSRRFCATLSPSSLKFEAQANSSWWHSRGQ